MARFAPQYSATRDTTEPSNQDNLLTCRFTRSLPTTPSMRVMAARHRLVALTLAAGLLLGTGGSAAAVDLSFSGAGWGHGVGLSQYGAKAMGAEGASYDKIIHRYFTGVNIVPVALAAPGTFVAVNQTPLWVGLLQNSDSVSFEVSTGSAWLCFDSSGGCVAIGQKGQTWRFIPDGTGRCVFLRVSDAAPPQPVGLPGSCEASVRPISADTTIAVPFKARVYRHGTLRFRPVPVSGATTKLHTIYEIGIEDYMKGLSEVPESWSQSAIEAQVVVSRSYAVRKALDRGSVDTFDRQRREDCSCNLRDDATDQVFRGWTGEMSHPRWVAAVTSTSQQVMASGGTVALGLYSSSSGGMTESYADVFGSDLHPYLATVSDTAAFTNWAGNPHAVWTSGLDQAILADAFGFSWIVDVQVGERNPSGSARTVRLVGIVGGRPAEILVTAVEMRSVLSLRSTTFDIVVFPRFADVAPNDMFGGEILGLLEMGITDGCTATSFCPNQAVTRAEMAAFLVRALDLAPASNDA